MGQTVGNILTAHLAHWIQATLILHQRQVQHLFLCELPPHYLLLSGSEKILFLYCVSQSTDQTEFVYKVH